ncbi:MAG: polyprenyl synthetase family protein [Eubacteriales bacterium]|nr:polyprenyl synthetase family protein [Eubacteriales bacterium]
MNIKSLDFLKNTDNLNDSELIELTLSNFLRHDKKLYDVLFDSMSYSVSAGGKRVRPMLTMEFAKLCGGSRRAAAVFGSAVEFIHTYSLIHDDLPCMDNDDMRRGKPSNHIAFSEDTALLAGDALQSLAFEVMLCDDAVSLVGADACVKAASVLAYFCGADGMVGGQVIDLLYENKSANEEIITEIHLLKTAALIKAACMMGAIISGADKIQLKAAEKYAECIGLTFQIVDDILDVTSTAEELGKPIGSDEENNKSTLVSLLGIDKCRELSEKYTNEAISALKTFEGDTKTLEDFALKLLNRRN